MRSATTSSSAAFAPQPLAQFERGTYTRLAAVFIPWHFIVWSFRNFKKGNREGCVSYFTLMRNRSLGSYGRAKCRRNSCDGTMTGPTFAQQIVLRALKHTR